MNINCLSKALLAYKKLYGLMQQYKIDLTYTNTATTFPNTQHPFNEILQTCFSNSKNKTNIVSAK